MANKGRSRALTGILCFIFGFIFAVIVVVGAVAAGVYFLLRADIDGLLGAAGVENTDGEGNKIYINTNEVKTITDLVGSLKGLADSGLENLTIGEVENIFPVADSAVDGLYSALAGVFSDNGAAEDYIRQIVDENQLKSTRVADLGDFLQDCFRGAEVQTAMRLFGMDPEENVLFLAVAYGAEASVVSGSDGSLTVLYRDNFLASDGGYVRETDGKMLGREFSGYLVLQPNESEYGLYYAVSGDAAYIAEERDGEFVITGVEYPLYDSSQAELSGAYYYRGEELVLTRSPRKIGEVLEDENGVLSAFRDVYINDAIESGDFNADSLLLIMFEGVTVGDLLDEKVEFIDLLDRITVSDVVDIPVNNALMMYMGYGLTDIAPAEDGKDYAYTGLYHAISADGSSGGTFPAYIVADSNGAITEVYFVSDGERFTAETGIGDVSARVEGLRDDLTIGEIMGIGDGDTENVVLYALRNSTINSLSEDINSLSVQQLFSYDVYNKANLKLVLPSDYSGTLYYLDGEEYTEVAAGQAGNYDSLFILTQDGAYAEVTFFDSAYLYYTFDGGNYNYVSPEGGALGHLDSYTDAYGALYTYGEVNGVWKLLLYADGAEVVCTVNSVTQMQNYVLTNLQTSTLYDLYDMEILSGSDVKDTLDKTVNLNGEYIAVGDLTVSQFVVYAGGIIA